MNRALIFKVLVFAAVAGSASAQMNRRAVITGGGSPNQGKCTIEVVVDGTAEVEIRGDNATLRNLAGQQPQWRRFECNAPMPANPVNFRFAGVDGRGRQDLLRDPRSGNGAAVVRIEDRDGGAEGYTFDLFWGGGGNQAYNPNPNNQPYNPNPNQVGPIGGFQDRRDGFDDRRNERGGPEYRDGQYYRDRRFTREETIRVCEDNIRQVAADRFGNRAISLRNVRIDDNPGRDDWVLGNVDVRGRFGRIESYRFSCSVNFDNGRVRTSQIDQFEDRYYNRRGE